MNKLRAVVAQLDSQFRIGSGGVPDEMMAGANIVS